MNTKGERVLRTEVIVHNTKELRGGRSLDYFPKIVLRLKEILERFLNMLYCIDACIIDEKALEDLPKPTMVRATRVGGINCNQARMRIVIEAVVALATSPNGLSASELAAQVRALSGQPESEYVPVLEAILHQFPFRILGFHSDNGSEFINRTVARLLEKLLIEFTKSRANRTQDNALVEGKNGAVIRKLMGYGHIAGEHAEALQRFYTAKLNPYLNFHAVSRR